VYGLATETSVSSGQQFVYGVSTDAVLATGAAQRVYGSAVGTVASGGAEPPASTTWTPPLSSTLPLMTP